LAEKLEESERRNTKIVAESRRQMIEKTKQLELLKVEKASLESQLATKDQHHEQKMEKKASEFKEELKRMQSTVNEWVGKEGEILVFLSEKEKLMGELAEKRETLCKFNEIKSKAVAKAKAEMQAIINEEVKAHKETQKAFDELEKKYTVLWEKEEIRIERRKKYPNLYKKKKKRQGQQSFGQMCINRVDNCQPEVLTRKQVRTIEALDRTLAGKLATSKTLSTSTGFGTSGTLAHGATDICASDSSLSHSYPYSRSQQSLPQIPSPTRAGWHGSHRPRSDTTNSPKQRLSPSNKTLESKLDNGFSLKSFIILPKFSGSGKGRSTFA